MVSIVVFVFGIIILEVLFILFIAGFHLAKFVLTKEATWEFISLIFVAFDIIALLWPDLYEWEVIHTISIIIFTLLVFIIERLVVFGLKYIWGKNVKLVFLIGLSVGLVLLAPVSATQVKLEEQKLVQQETELADFSLKDIYLANTRETIRYFNLLIPISIGLGFCTTTIFLFANRKR